MDSKTALQSFFDKPFETDYVAKPLPEAFNTTMDDNAPVTKNNLLEWFAEESMNMRSLLLKGALTMFSDDIVFRHFARRKDHVNMWKYIFAQQHYEKGRMCYIVDMAIVCEIYRCFDGVRHRCRENFLVSPKMVCDWVDDYKVELCMCLKKYMCYSLWHTIGRHMVNNMWEEWEFADIHEYYNDWNRENNEQYGGVCVRRAVVGRSRLCFLNLLRDAWTTPRNKHRDKYPNKSEYNILYPNASELWHPPKKKRWCSRQ